MSSIMRSRSALTGGCEGWEVIGQILSSRRLQDLRCSGADAPIVTPERSSPHRRHRQRDDLQPRALPRQRVRSVDLSGRRGSPLQRSAEIPCPSLLEQAIGRQSVPALPGAGDCLGARWAGDQTVRHIAIEIGDLDLSSSRHKHPESRRGISRLARREHASVHQRGRQPAPDHGGWRIALRRTCSSYPRNSGGAPSFLPVRNAVLTLPMSIRLIRPRASRW